MIRYIVAVVRLSVAAAVVSVKRSNIKLKGVSEKWIWKKAKRKL